MPNRPASYLRSILSGYGCALRPRPVRLTSSLTVEEASRRLQAGLTRRSWIGPAPWTTWRWAIRGFSRDEEPDRIVTGSVKPSRIRLAALVPGVRNSWRPTFRGRLQTGNGHTELVGNIGYFPGVRVFSFFWGGLVSLFFVVSLCVAVVMLAKGRWDEARTAAFLAVVAAGMLIFGLALASGATRLGDRDEEWLRQWLADRLNG